MLLLPSSYLKQLKLLNLRFFSSSYFKSSSCYCFRTEIFFVCLFQIRGGFYLSLSKEGQVLHHGIKDEVKIR